MNTSKTPRYLASAAVIAALYVVLTLAVLPLASGAIQLRLSEALTILPVFVPAAIPGLTIGCLLANILGGCVFWDIVFGPIATLIGAVATRLLRNRGLWAVVPPIVSNMVIIPLVLRYAYELPESIPYLMLTVGAGELLSAGVLGGILLRYIGKNKAAQRRMFDN